MVAVEITDFSVFYNQDSIANAESSLGEGGHKIVVQNGQIIKVSKDKTGIATREVLTKNWTDWIDYWAVDFDFESKREIIRVNKTPGVCNTHVTGVCNTHVTGVCNTPLLSPQHSALSTDFEEVWTGDYVFENEWQSFRTKKDRKLELISIFKECPPGRRKIAVKVVDIFGNDTMKVIEVGI